MKKFTTEPLIEIVWWLQQQLERDSTPGRIIEFLRTNPDLRAGKEGKLPGHSLKNWLDLAEYFNCRLLLPHLQDSNLVRIRMQVLDSKHDWHKNLTDDATEKYGVDSEYAGIEKLEEPYFLLDYLHCLRIVSIQSGWRILNLGVNRGDEFAALNYVVSPEDFASLHLVGVDHSESAIQAARLRFSENNHTFFCSDINKLHELNLGRFELIISISTLQSPGLDRETVLRQLVQQQCKDKSALLFAFPNCRYIDGEIKYGAMMRNYSTSELSLLVKDVSFYKKYLQQHKFKVRIFGKYYLFVVAVR
ncbi:MAG: class I SAM-dependent methyltransferase [Deferribacteres bacterium]|nr:class I SAM-dependent methyltransferase [candidate division KSB1 bacterium]MCB9504239.1 class I SAM-dependent methyltransferase [Deferribacteres bacterium]